MNTATDRPTCDVFGVAHAGDGVCRCRRMLDRVEAADPPEHTLSGVEAAKLLGVTHQTFHRWVTDHGADFGIDNPNPGTGHSRRVPVSSLDHWRVVADLVSFGLPPSTVFALPPVERERLRDAMAPTFADMARP